MRGKVNVEVLAEKIIESVEPRLEDQYWKLRRGEVSGFHPHTLWIYTIARDSQGYPDFREILKKTVANILAALTRPVSPPSKPFTWLDEPCLCGYAPTVPIVELLSASGAPRYPFPGVCPAAVITNYTLKNLSRTVILTDTKLREVPPSFRDLMPPEAGGSIINNPGPVPGSDWAKLREALGKVEVYYVFRAERYNTEIVFADAQTNIYQALSKPV